MFTYRQAYRGSGRKVVFFHATDIQEKSSVLISAAEIRALGANPHDRFTGNANIWVSNISPKGNPGFPQNGVEFVLNIDEEFGDLDVQVEITVLESQVVYDSPGNLPPVQL